MHTEHFANRIQQTHLVVPLAGEAEAARADS
jgi:hypothetical protein